MILHIPHSSTDTLGKTFLCDLSLELARMTDTDTDKLFQCNNATKIIFPISRLICDVERFEDNSVEEMAKKGMGVCYTTNSFGDVLRNVEEDERADIIDRYYRPHHQKLSEAVEEELKTQNRALIIDCHSFSNIPLPHEECKTERVDICIGTDDFHTSKSLSESAVKYFRSCGYRVALNEPFAGTLIPMNYYQHDKRVKGLMIEVNRDLYKSNFSEVQRNISIWLNEVLLEF